MSRFWSSLTHDLKPYVPGEQPRIAELVKLNTNESPFGPSPRALEAIRAEAADTLRLYPDPQASALRAALATYHEVRPEQVFVGNGSRAQLRTRQGRRKRKRRLVRRFFMASPSGDPDCVCLRGFRYLPHQ